MNKIIDYILKEAFIVECVKSKKITWIVPKLNEEIGEYFENDYAKKFLKSKGIVFKSDDDILLFLGNGKLVSITRDELIKKFNNLTLTYSDFMDELKDPEYKKSFESMEKKLKNDGIITLPAPIVLKIKGEYYGFSGNRRMNLAFKNNIQLKIWLVEVKIKNDN